MYIIIAYKYGKRESHSYTLALCSVLEKAKQIANDHVYHRGGTYACVVEECALDQFNQEDYQNYTKEVYRAKSILEV